MLALYACKKDSNNAKPTITGKWNLVSDSTYVGVGLNNHLVTFQGQPGDYFDFRTDGHVYTKEATVLDTLTYQLTSNTTIIISSFGVTLNGVPETSYIRVLTAHNLAIDAPRVVTPGGVGGRKLKLSR
jgi:hypothetical protein